MRKKRQQTSLRDRVRENALSKEPQPVPKKQIEFHKPSGGRIETFRQEQRKRVETRMSDTNVPANPGGALAPLVRNWVRVLAGMALGVVVSFLSAKGVINPDAFTPEKLEALLNSEAGMAVVGFIATGAIAAVDALWLRARKLGKPT